jgi:hypothetical protein
MTAVAQSDTAQRVVTLTDNRFYTRMAYACATVGAIGFAPTYWTPLLSGTIDVPPILHLHALVFYGWLALLITQARLAAARRLTRHRELGVFGVALVTAMCFVGTAAAVSSIKQADAAGFGDAARAFSVVPLTGIAFFAALFVIALLNVKRPDVHKRLMLVATVSILNAAVGRLFILALGGVPPGASVEPPPVLVTVPAGLVTDLLLVPALLHDRKRLGHVHRTYWIAGAALLASQLLRVPLAATTMWQQIAGGVAGLVP